VVQVERVRLSLELLESIRGENVAVGARCDLLGRCRRVPASLLSESRRHERKRKKKEHFVSTPRSGPMGAPKGRFLTKFCKKDLAFPAVVGT